MIIFKDWISYYNYENAEKLITKRDDSEFDRVVYKNYSINSIPEIKTCEITRDSNLVAIMCDTDIDDAMRYVDELTAVNNY